MSGDEYEEKVKGDERKKKLNKKRAMMRVNGRHLKSVILPLLEKKSKPKSDFVGSRVTIRDTKAYSFN